MSCNYLTELSRLVSSRPAPRDGSAYEESKVDDATYVRNVGYSPNLPPDDALVSSLPSHIRLSKFSWLNSFSIPAFFSDEVKEGDLVIPMTLSEGTTLQQRSGISENNYWKPFSVSSSSIPPVWGIAFLEAGRIVFGPVVRHERFDFPVGSPLYAGQDGVITTTPMYVPIGVSLGVNAIYFDLSSLISIYKGAKNVR